MKKQFIDPLIKRKANLTKNVQFYKKNIPLPSVIEISESGTCNRKCSFCPRSAPDFNDIKEFISEDLIIKLSKQLSEYNYSGIFLFSGFVEPMLDKNIYNLVSIVRKNLPNARIEMVTNGDVLNEERAKKLFKSGLSTLLISIYDGKKEADEMEQLMKNSGANEDQYKVRHRYLPESESFGITLSILIFLNHTNMTFAHLDFIKEQKQIVSDPNYSVSWGRPISIREGWIKSGYRNIRISIIESVIFGLLPLLIFYRQYRRILTK